MATIQLDEDVLAVEALIDVRQHDEAFRRLMMLRDRLGRRPEGRYLQALFDATFAVRGDAELVREVNLLVADQPDFLEAVSLLAVLLERVGDRERALVFAREALRAHNPSAQRRARDVIGERSSTPSENEELFPRRSSSRLPAVQVGRASQPEALRAPMTRSETPVWNPAVQPLHMATGLTSPRGFAPESAPPHAEARHATPPPPAPGAVFDPLRLPTEPPPALEPLPSPHAVRPDSLSPSVPPGAIAGSPQAPTLPPEGDSLEPQPDTVDLRRVAAREPSTRSGLARPAPHDSVETIPFSPHDLAIPPPPTLPPEAAHAVTRDRERTGPQSAQVIDAIRRAPTQPRTPIVPRTGAVAQGASKPSSIPPPGAAAPRSRLASRPHGDAISVDQTGTRRPSPSSPSRPAIAIPEPVEQVRHWFRYARDHQVQRQPGGNDSFSTALTLLELAERVVEGATPLSSESVPLDRRGLILVEQRLESMRSTGRNAATERGAVTAAAAFMLAVLLKDCDGRVVDTSAEDGACKVTVSTGATVRPLLVAAAFARARGPGLVETFDRAATAHMRRAPARPTSKHGVSRSAPPRAVREFGLSVLRRDLDASTLAAVEPHAPPAPQPHIDMRAVGEAFWASSKGMEIIGNSRRVGTFTIADIDAIERYAGKTFSGVGFAPPGTPWPWIPNEELDELTFSFGVVLGEVLASVYAGRWEADPGNPDDRQLFRVVLSGGVVAWPVAKAYLRLARGIPHDLSVYVDAVGRVVGRQTLSPGWRA